MTTTRDALARAKNEFHERHGTRAEKTAGVKIVRNILLCAFGEGRDEIVFRFGRFGVSK